MVQGLGFLSFVHKRKKSLDGHLQRQFKARIQQVLISLYQAKKCRFLLKPVRLSSKENCQIRKKSEARENLC